MFVHRVASLHSKHAVRRVTVVNDGVKRQDDVFNMTRVAPEAGGQGLHSEALEVSEQDAKHFEPK